MKNRFLSLGSLLLATSLASQAAITTITLGNTTVSVNNQVGINASGAAAGTNFQPSNNGVNPGGLFNMTFNGTSLFDPIDAVRDNGFALGTSNFANNYIGLPATNNVTVSGLSSTSNSVTVSGSYLNGVGGGALGLWTRTYTLLANGVVREVVTFQNTTGSALSNFRMHGSFDPDQGSTSQITQNTQGVDTGYNYARAILGNGISSILASTEANVGFFYSGMGFGLSVSSACVDALVGGPSSCLLYSAPLFGTVDASYGWARNFVSVGAGETVSTTVFHVFSTGLDLTQSLNLIGTPPPPIVPDGEVPEPSTWALMGSALVGIGVAFRRRNA